MFRWVERDIESLEVYNLGESSEPTLKSWRNDVLDTSENKIRPHTVFKRSDFGSMNPGWRQRNIRDTRGTWKEGKLGKPGDLTDRDPDSTWLVGSGEMGGRWSSRSLPPVGRVGLQDPPLPPVVDYYLEYPEIDFQVGSGVSLSTQKNGGIFEGGNARFCEDNMGRRLR